jgi:hypothetical protein
MEGKMMLTSYGETSGFKAVDSGELELINGGKTGGGGGGGGISVTGSPFPSGVQVKDGNVTVTAKATSVPAPSKTGLTPSTSNPGVYVGVGISW